MKVSRKGSLTRVNNGFIFGCERGGNKTMGDFEG